MPFASRALVTSSVAISGCAPLLAALPWNPMPQGRGIQGFYEAQVFGYTMQTCGFEVAAEMKPSCETRYVSLESAEYDRLLQCSKKLWEEGSYIPVYRRWAGVTHGVLSSMGGPGVIRIRTCATGEGEDNSLNEDLKVKSLLSRFGLAKGETDLEDYFRGFVVDYSDIPGSEKLALIYADVHLPVVSEAIAEGTSHLAEEGLRLFASEGLPRNFQLTRGWAQDPTARPFAPVLIARNEEISTEVWGIEDFWLHLEGLDIYRWMQKSDDPNRYSVFLESADARSLVMATNFHDLIQSRKDAPAAVLYTGAIHVPIIAEKLGQFGISYLVIVPEKVSLGSYRRIAGDHKEIGLFLAKRDGVSK